MQDFKDKFAKLTVKESLGFVAHLRKNFGEEVNDNEITEISDDLKETVKSLTELSQADLAKLYEEIKTEWNIPDLAVATNDGGNNADEDNASEEKKTFTATVEITNRIAALKAIQKWKGLDSMMQAMKLIAKTGPTKFENLSQEEVDQLKAEIEKTPNKITIA
ncbi:MAG: hypothetical protein AAFO15_02755 [Pseudomonadota bacterium]